MSIELIRPTPEHVPELGRIVFEAFKGISQAHNFPLDIPNPEMAAMLVGALIARPDFYGIVAVESSTLLGCNFLQTSDAVGGVGPLCINPHHQSAGIGRRLMKHIVDHALKSHGPMVRLVQDSFNMRSLSLYTSLGFTVQEPLVLMEIAPAAEPDSRARPLTLDDLSACDALCKLIYKVSRKNELAAMITHGSAMSCVPMGLFFGNRLLAFVVPGFFGFSASLVSEDLLAALQQAARNSPPPLRRALIPCRLGDLFRLALKHGCKSIKVMNLMSMGPYDTPTHAWSPSVTY